MTVLADTPVSYRRRLLLSLPAPDLAGVDTALAMNGGSPDAASDNEILPIFAR
jgi:hypothetical protein